MCEGCVEMFQTMVCGCTVLVCLLHSHSTILYSTIPVLCLYRLQWYATQCFCINLLQYSCICCELGVLDHAMEVGLQSDWSESISLAVSHLQEQSGCVLTRLHLAQFLWTVVGEGGRKALTQICKEIIREWTCTHASPCQGGPHTLPVHTH